MIPPRVTYAEGALLFDVGPSVALTLWSKPTTLCVAKSSGGVGEANPAIDVRSARRTSGGAPRPCPPTVPRREQQSAPTRAALLLGAKEQPPGPQGASPRRYKPRSRSGRCTCVPVPLPVVPKDTNTNLCSGTFRRTHADDWLATAVGQLARSSQRAPQENLSRADGRSGMERSNSRILTTHAGSLQDHRADPTSSAPVARARVRCGG